ncbi:uncharacterized protein CBL_11840 [Carabus blaptoides fortunei]
MYVYYHLSLSNNKFEAKNTMLAAPAVNTRIIGGVEADIGDIPYIVSVRAMGKAGCGGTILSETYVVTAAHCIYTCDTVASSISIQYGTVDITGSENLITAEKITYHEDFIVGGSYPNDVAVIKLSDNIIFGPTAQPVKLPETTDTPEGSVLAVLVGWGRNETNGNSLKHLQKVDYIKFSDVYCQSTESKYNSLYHVCAGVIGGGKGQCTLASDIDFGVNAQPVKLPESSSVPPGDVDAVLIGWGLTASVGGISPTILKKINYTKFSDEYCKATVLCYNPNYHICAGIIGGGKGQCSVSVLNQFSIEN